jgi:glycosyltransferase involved in cell wall biosynthesis
MPFMPPEKPRILIIIPAFNAANYLPDLIERICAFWPPDNVLVVNDGSTDVSSQVLDRFTVAVITFEQNRGKGAALRAGFDFALKHSYDAVITMDADLQHCPEHIPDFVNAYDTADILIGTRPMHRRNMPIDRLLTNNTTSLVVSVFGSIRARDSQSGFRLIKTDVLKHLRLTSNRYDTESEILLQAGRLGFTAAEVSIDTLYEGSPSSIHPLKDTGRFIRQIWRRLWY